MQAAALPRHSWLDALLAALAAAHGAVLAIAPSAPVVALGVWWSSNTVSHNFIHRPFFRRRWMNVLFSLYLSLLLGIPQALWRERHLAHHAGRPVRFRPGALLAAESCCVLCLWALLLAAAPRFFLAVYVPGYAIGLALCALHGRYEHARGTVSHYGAAYNWLFFNDGYHVEHHRWPGLHWSELPRHAVRGAAASRWPPVLRWLELLSLESLERLALRSGVLRRWMLDSHERAFRSVLPRISSPQRIAIVGGGLFPRTALVLRRLLPEARLVIIDSSAESIERAMPFLQAIEGADGRLEVIHDAYDPDRHAGFDLVVVPLAFRGDRARLYALPAAPAVAVHDWIWRRRGSSAVVSPLLLKRLNLVTP